METEAEAAVIDPVNVDVGGDDVSSKVSDTVHDAPTVLDVIMQSSIMVATPFRASVRVEKTALMECVEGPSVTVTGWLRWQRSLSLMHWMAMVVAEESAVTTLPCAPVMGRVVGAALKSGKRVVWARVVVAAIARRERIFIVAFLLIYEFNRGDLKKQLKEGYIE